MECSTCLKCKLEELPDQPIITNAVVDGFFVKKIQILKADSFVPQHSHDYDHVTVLGTGSVQFYKAGVFLGIKKAPEKLFIQARVLHSFRTLEDNTTLFCVHPSEDGSEPKIFEENSLQKLEKLLWL